MYQESDLVCIGKRENNKKRNYLVVNKLQGKHIPVSPSKALGMFDALADILKEKYSGKKLLLVGFAETATAIGAEIAIKLGAYYIQTTREIIDICFFRKHTVMRLNRSLLRKILKSLLERLSILYLLKMKLQLEIRF